MISGQDTPPPWQPEKLFVFSASRLASGLRFFGHLSRGYPAEEVEMRKGFRVALTTAAVAAGVALAGAPPAQ
ncbi:MAG TPA: hypothetical protein VN971_04710, partial [Thermoanaerobaculia bacterium]|nr:hypothetical protein [Thermoanaerobaculia bacterium]